MGFVLMTVVVGGSTCRPSASDGGTTAPTITHPPGTGPAADGPHEGQSAAELKLRLDKLAEQQAGLIPAASRDPNTCEEVCSLATSICSVQEKLCEIADGHPSEVEYQALCRDARQECREAQDACVRCVELHRKR